MAAQDIESSILEYYNFLSPLVMFPGLIERRLLGQVLPRVTPIGILREEDLDGLTAPLRRLFPKCDMVYSSQPQQSLCSLARKSVRQLALQVLILHRMRSFFQYVTQE